MAATLTPGNELTYASFPIEKWEENPDGSGSILVYGQGDHTRVDTDEQVVDPTWSAKALTTGWTPGRTCGCSTTRSATRPAPA